MAEQTRMPSTRERLLEKYATQSTQWLDEDGTGEDLTTVDGPASTAPVVTEQALSEYIACARALESQARVSLPSPTAAGDRRDQLWRALLASHTDLLARYTHAEEMLRQVAALHPRGETSYPPGEGYVSEPEDYIKDGCQTCQVPWPCATANILAGAEPAKDTSTMRATEPRHIGGNAESCPACKGTNPPWPFICPGEPSNSAKVGRRG